MEDKIDCKEEAYEAAEGVGNREYSAPTSGVGSDAGQADPGGGGKGKLLSPSRRRACVDHVTAELGISERRACRALGQHRSTQRKIPTTPDDEAALTADIIELAHQYGRYGYRRITALLRRAGWGVNKKRDARAALAIGSPRTLLEMTFLYSRFGNCDRSRRQEPCCRSSNA
jgi:hypothetical protein